MPKTSKELFQVAVGFYGCAALAFGVWIAVQGNLLGPLLMGVGVGGIHWSKEGRF